MTDRSADRDDSTVFWERVTAESVERPIVRRLPYVELKLEHPELTATRYGDRFFPDAVPYEFEGTERVFYWQPAVRSPSTDPSDWTLGCATTHALLGYETLPASAPELATPDEDVTTVVVDGTVAGETTTTQVRSYATPTVRFERVSDDALVLTVEATEYRVAAGDRHRITLSERRVEPVDGEPTTVRPRLSVRYPGSRELHHPAVGSTDRIFPSFGLDLETLPNPLGVPTAGGELDDEALAERIGIELSTRPFSERILWQAFAYSTFDPHRATTPRLTQLDSGHLVVRGTNSSPGPTQA